MGSLTSAGALLFVASMIGCTKAAECPPPAPAVPPPAALPPASSAYAPLPPSPLREPAPSATPADVKGATVTVEDLTVSSFDCVKMETKAPPAVTSTCGSEVAEASEPRSRGIRAWNGGGPEGSNWNADGLVCVASLRASCDGGTTVTLKVGSKVLGRAKVEGADPTRRCRFVLPRKSWERELDRGEDLPFKTGIFRVDAYHTCSEPMAVHRAADHFVAGFAWGE